MEQLKRQGPAQVFVSAYGLSNTTIKLKKNEKAVPSSVIE